MFVVLSMKFLRIIATTIGGLLRRMLIRGKAGTPAGRISSTISIRYQDEPLSSAFTDPASPDSCPASAFCQSSGIFIGSIGYTF